MTGVGGTYLISSTWVDGIFLSYVANDHGIINLQDWNPMEDDYFSKRNIYKIDDEDTGLALEGYS